MKTAMEFLSDERKRQVEKGYDAAHDDGHDDGSLAALAAFLAAPDDSNCRIAMKPWASQYADHIGDKWGGDRVKCLIIAGALIVAEIERLQRRGG